MTGVTKAPRVAVAALLILLAPLGGHVEALPLSIVVAALLTVLAVWELRSAGSSGQTGKVLQTRGVHAVPEPWMAPRRSGFESP